MDAISQVKHAVLARLVRSFAATRSAATRRARINFAAIVVLIVFVVCYMGWIYAGITALNAGELTKIAFMRVEDMGPDLQRELKARALEIAPEIMARGREQLLAAPARLREEIETRLNEELDAVLAAWEDQVGREIETNIAKTVTLLQEAHPQGSTTAERVDAVMRHVLDGYKGLIKDSIDHLYDEQVVEMRQLHEYFLRLQTGEALTETERLQREVLEVWVVLVQKHKITTPTVSGK